MNKQRRLRKRSILSLIPMAMIVLGASPGRPLQIGRGLGRSVSRSARYGVNKLNKAAVFHPRRNESKVRHVVHSDNFSHESSDNGRRLRRGERIQHGPWLPNDFSLSRDGQAIQHGGRIGFRQRTKMIQRGLVEIVLRSVHLRNNLQFRKVNISLPFVNRENNAGAKIISSRNNSNAIRGSKRMMFMRPFLNLFDRRKIRMETVDAMHVMGGDMSEVEYSDAMAIVSPTNVKVATKIRPEKKSRRNLFRISLFKEKENTVKSSAISARGGAISTRARVSPSAPATNLSMKKSTSTASISTKTPTNRNAASQASIVQTSDTWIIETPLFPIILPKSWEPISSVEEISSTEIMEISVALEQDQETLTKPSLSILQTATQPLIPKSAWSSFHGNELYYPESMEMLASTGINIALGDTVDWVGEKKTEKFLQDHKASDGSLLQALISTHEVLAWSSKFTSEGQGAELPLIKTMAVIDKSPEYLAELLMDSSKVKAYNKMSLGRSDEEVFQSGINTVGGTFGDGESKVVRNLTKPPMVNNILEFITCMHARKLKPEDNNLLQANIKNDDPMEGYVVVSRAVTGGKWSPTNNPGEKYIRNEILLGVNLLKAVPGEPDKTELTAVTHVYSPLIPLMLAKNAGLKGATDFVRDIRAID